MRVQLNYATVWGICGNITQQKPRTRSDTEFYGLGFNNDSRLFTAYVHCLYTTYEVLSIYNFGFLFLQF